MSATGATMTAIVTGRYREPAAFADHVERAVRNHRTLDFMAQTVSPHPEARDFAGTVYKTVGNPAVPGGLGVVFMTDHVFGPVQIIVSKDDVRVTYEIS